MHTHAHMYSAHARTYLRPLRRPRGLLVPDADGMVGRAGGEAPPIIVELRVQHVVAVARVHAAPAACDLRLRLRCWILSYR